MSWQLLLSTDPAIAGEGADGAIDVLAWSWGASAETSVDQLDPRRGANPQFEELSLVKLFDLATPRLLAFHWSGQAFNATLRMVPAGLVSRVAGPSLELGNCVVTSYSVGGSGGEDAPSDNFTLAYQTIKVSQPQPDLKEPATFGWDLPLGRTI